VEGAIGSEVRHQFGQREINRMSLKTLSIVSLLLTASLVSYSASGKFIQQGEKLVGTGGSISTAQGRSTALSADGNTAIVGGPNDSPYGAAWIFVRDADGAWRQQGNKLVGGGAVGNSQQGNSVSLSADGNTAIVGGWTDNSGAGAAWIFTRQSGVWTQQGPKLVANDASLQSWQGFSVALSGDGNTAIVGGPIEPENGASWIYTRSGGVWTQQGSKLVGNGGFEIGAEQGYSVALSGNGDTAIVGSPGGRSHGAGWVFTRSGTTWAQQGGPLFGTGDSANTQGISASLSSDGNTVILGDLLDGALTGAAWVFVRSASVWTQQGPKLVGAGGVGIQQQATSVSVSGDGNILFIGGPFDDSNNGAAWVFARTGGVWTQQGNKLVGTGSGVSGGASQGTSVAISADGTTALVGADSDNGAGATWVYVTQSVGAPLLVPALGWSGIFALSGLIFILSLKSARRFSVK
jgi:hypothetical protein